MPVSLLSVYNEMTGSFKMEFLMSELIPRILIFFTAGLVQKAAK